MAELLKELDTDGDGQVSREEWRRGWGAGVGGINRTNKEQLLRRQSQLVR